jgi:hypothetical protein
MAMRNFSCVRTVLFPIQHVERSLHLLIYFLLFFQFSLSKQMAILTPGEIL